MKRICTLFLMLTVATLIILAFASCDKATEGLEFYEYEDGYAASISDGKFLDKIVIPKEHNGKSVVAISKRGFSGCENAVTISIPNTVKTIDEGAFQNCYKLESITIPSSVTVIGESAFKGCKALKSIEIPSSVTSIDKSAFSNCRELTSIQIGDTVTEIGALAFEGCTALENVTIPRNVNKIGEGVFQGCTKLTSISVDESSESYASENGVLYNKDMTALIQYPIGKKEFEFVAPASITSVGAYAFAGGSALTKLSLPGTVTSVGEKAFDGCPIENAVAPACAIKEISQDTIKTFEINGGEKIEKNAFRNCQFLKRVTITGVKEIGDSAFYNCASLRSAALGEGLEIIDEYAFKGCVYLSEVTLPDSLKTIGASAFKDCNRIAKIIIPINVETIDMYAFEGCISIRIYCRAAGKPSGWNKWWNSDSSKYSVTWRYAGE
ncbi:MAG: leucine-rich repeat domain-containing protein [Clostridia bacterium]|nr:leucine-rich repeat domain-containing protein [Clostridia bacterium]